LTIAQSPSWPPGTHTPGPRRSRRRRVLQSGDRRDPSDARRLSPKGGNDEASEEERKRECRTNLGSHDRKSEREPGENEVLPLRLTELPEVRSPSSTARAYMPRLSRPETHTAIRAWPIPSRLSRRRGSSRSGPAARMRSASETVPHGPPPGKRFLPVGGDEDRMHSVGRHHPRDRTQRGVERERDQAGGASCMTRSSWRAGYSSGESTITQPPRVEDRAKGKDSRSGVLLDLRRASFAFVHSMYVAQAAGSHCVRP
jgi:hypothetical protein